MSVFASSWNLANALEAKSWPKVIQAIVVSALQHKGCTATKPLGKLINQPPGHPAMLLLGVNDQMDDFYVVVCVPEQDIAKKVTSRIYGGQYSFLRCIVAKSSMR